MGGVDPSHRRQGISSALLAWQIGAARRLLLASPPGLKRHLRTMACDFEHEAIALYERHGLRPVRYQDELLRPLDRLEPVASIAGIDLRPWDLEQTEELRRGLRRSFRQEGFTHAVLGVDSESPTGAYRIYQRLGFEPLHRSGQHQLAVRVGPDEPTLEDQAPTALPEASITHQTSLRP